MKDRAFKSRTVHARTAPATSEGVSPGAGPPNAAQLGSDVYRTTLFRVWRRMAESMPWDDFSDHVATQAVGAAFLESEEGIMSAFFHDAL